MLDPSIAAAARPYRMIHHAPLTPMPSPGHCLCPRCKTWVMARKAHWGWKAAEISFWLSCPIALLVLKGFGIVAVPFILMFAGGLAGPLRSIAGAEPQCPSCRCYLTPAE